MDYMSFKINDTIYLKTLQLFYLTLQKLNENLTITNIISTTFVKLIELVYKLCVTFIL